ncbi:hypothetical protein [Corynebacterium hindlerae]|uniref:hypothetical protein n=1 Tax=Corynebacterium hindlerae TaxID=699041 RepID=UPI003AAACA75
MTTGTSRTGPKPRFAEQDAVNIALELGLTDFTLGAVADRLGVRTSALYRIIASRDHSSLSCASNMSQQTGHSNKPQPHGKLISLSVSTPYGR